MCENLKRPLKGVALFLVSSFVLMTACKRPEDEIGLQLQPGDEILQANSVDTFTVAAFTELDDSVRTDKTNPALIGAYNDPVFGLTKAGHVTELRLTSINPDFLGDTSTVDDIQVDSLILVLSYAKTLLNGDTVVSYGNGLAQQFFEVYEITDSLSVDSSYYENTPVNFVPDDLVKPGHNFQTPHPEENALVGGDTLGPQIRIPLKEELANRIIAASADGGLTGLEFIELLKGLYIKVDETMSDPNSTDIISFDTFTGASRMIMYYQDTRSGDDSLRYSFTIRNNTGKYNQIEHDYSMAASNLMQQLDGNYESTGQDLYLQSGAGLKLRVDIPFIANLADSTDIAINKAELIMPVRQDDIGQYPPPVQLFIFGRNENGTLFQLTGDNSNAVSGLYDRENHTYSFVISRYLQQIILGTRENYGLEIVAVGAGRTANRVVINGMKYPNPLSPENNTKLAITFTKF